VAGTPEAGVFKIRGRSFFSNSCECRERFLARLEAILRPGPGLDATNWRAELAIRFGVILRKVCGGSRTWPGARAQSVLMSVWRTCWQQGRCALDFLSQLLRGTPAALVLPP
jgi:transposase